MKHSFDDLRNTRTIILNEDEPEEKREEIRRYFHATYSIDEALYDTLVRDEAFYLRSEPLRHPLIFYFGHTASFFINKLIVSKLTDRRIEPKFESMFAVGVDEMSWDDLNDAHYEWPTVDEVRTYRQKVREFVDQLISELPLSIPITWDSPFWIIMMGIEHQRIHLETSSVIIRRMPIGEVQPLPLWPICPEAGEAPKNELVPVSGGTVQLGKRRDDRLYGWDNEYGHAEEKVCDFSASRYLVSNREFMPFIEDGGYATRDLWSDEGWSWVTYAEARHPLFWVPDGETYRFRTMARIIEMPWDWPVELNQLEAKAFCNWMAKQTGKPIRLPTEAEWHRLRETCDLPDQPDWELAPGNINLEHWASSCSVNHFRHGDFYDVIGNVWQWTETPIDGFDGFEIHPSYDDFSTPTFDTRHNLIKGGSWISTGNEATIHARYAFRRHFFQHAGLRYVESDQPVEEPEATYEQDAAVAQYCEAHYGSEYFSVPNFSANLAQRCVNASEGGPRRRVLDIGCAVGRAAFELAKHFEKVDALDFSARFIRIAHQLQQRGSTRYELPEEGELVSLHEISLTELGLADTADRIEFWQADAANLKPQFTEYDVVLAANLIDRMVNPSAFLDQIHKRIVPGGHLLLASPYTWLQEFTAKEKWIGGVRRDGEPLWTIDGLREILGRHFEITAPPEDVPFVIRETRRKFQHTLAQLTVWCRNP